LSYDPRAHGARCHECPLEGCRVVPPESHAHATIAAVGEAPGEQEEKLVRPFVGPSGNEFMRAARMAGLRRSDFHITNALLCRPPGNELKKLLAKISKWNKKEAKEAKAEKRKAETMKTPLECCAPRLEAELTGFSDFITLGGVGTKAVAGTSGSILGLRGGLMELDRHPGQPNGGSIRVMPTIHPAFVLRQQKWAHVFRNDMAKAARWFRGTATWVPPKVTYNPGPETLRRFLADRNKIYTFDIETDGIECLTAHIRCIAIGDDTDVMVVGFRSNTQPKDREGLFLDFYDQLTAFTVGAILVQFFADPAITKCGHNAGYYDRIVLREQMGVDPIPVLDTILLHRNVESELPHSLAYVASLYTEAPSWKTGREGNKLALGGESDDELHEYCANDVVITARVLPPLAGQVALRKQQAVWRSDQKMQLVCADMHTVGMYVDQAKRMAEEKKLLAVRFSLLTEIRDRLDLPSFNPGSVYQLRDVLFGAWGLESHIDATDLKEKDTITGGGDRSTGDLILRTLLTLKTVPNDQREIIKLIRRYRKCLKVLGTYVVKLRPWDMGADLGWDDDDDWVDRETRKKYGEEKRGIVDPRTGRMHPGYNMHVAVTGRLSSSKPINCFDGETEILTPDGWVRFDELEEGVHVAQWHEEGLISFVMPTAYHRGHHKGEMVRFQHQSADLLMTPNHRLPLKKTSGRLETVTAEELLTLGAGRKTIHAAHLLAEGDGYPISDAELRLVVALHADASFTQRDGAVALDVGFTKARKIKRFRELLEQVDVEKKESPEGRFLLSGERLEGLLDYIQGKERKWGPWLLHLHDRQARIFEAELWFWDGCWGRKSQYANKDEENIDWIQTFLVLQGIRTNKRFYTNADGNSVWILDVRRTETNGVTDRAVRERVPWDDMVYCVTVPSDAIMVRRGGKVTITRQSQNFPSAQRGMVVPAPGHVLVGADMDQVELRIAASLWGVDLYLRAFAEGKDPHSMTAYAVFGEEFCKAAGLTSSQFLRPGKLVSRCYDADGVFLKGASADATSMRNLSKAVQYACIEKDEPVAVLGPEGSKPISELQVGEWTWCWSRKRKRYEAAEITEVMPRGKKECVKLTFSWWGGPRKGRCTESVIVTDDHLCMLRDGTFRAAGDLKPDDRLMPFRRREGGTCGPYRRIMPFNDKRECNEHRVVMGFYEKDPTHVHHDDENTLNNNPDNLKTKHSKAHYAIHKESVDAGRRNSQKWRDSVSDSATRSVASKKMWERRRQEGTARFGSVLDPYAERIGHEPDRVIAAEAGCTPQSVYDWRKRRGIPAYWREAPGGNNHKVVSVEPVGVREVWDIEVDHEDHNFPLAAGIFVHNSQYMGTVEIVHQLIQKTELPSVDPLTKKPRDDGTTDLPYAKLPLRKVREMREKWLEGAREFEYGWEKEIAEFREQGYLAEPVGGRRRDFLDGEDPNQIVNFKVQGGAAGLMNKAMVQLHEAIPLHRWGPGTGIINQCHDSIVVECPEEAAKEVAGLLEECMNQTHRNLPRVVFSASADVGMSWKEVG
jgi:DNA polymerase I-like protein with 3'-5' exonuclease and polymerase domains/uracil-DNA glycosylase